MILFPLIIPFPFNYKSNIQSSIKSNLSSRNQSFRQDIVLKKKRLQSSNPLEIQWQGKFFNVSTYYKKKSVLTFLIKKHRCISKIKTSNESRFIVVQFLFHDSLFNTKESQLRLATQLTEQPRARKSPVLDHEVQQRAAPVLPGSQLQCNERLVRLD